jgi:hypothetical protein
MTEVNFFTPSERVECGVFRRFGADFVNSPASPSTALGFPLASLRCLR